MAESLSLEIKISATPRPHQELACMAIRGEATVLLPSAKNLLRHNGLRNKDSSGESKAIESPERQNIPRIPRIFIGPPKNDAVNC